MDPQLEQYLKVERSRGLSDEVIRHELLAKGWDPIAIHRAMQLKSTPQPQDSHLSGSLPLLIVGLSLVIIAAISFFGYSWPQLSPLSRFLVIAIPNLALFLIGSLLAKGEDLRLVKESTHTTGHLLLPATIGVFLYQFGFYSRVDYLLLTYSTLLAVPLYVYVAWYKKQYYGFALIMLASLAIAFFLLADIVLDGWRSSLIVTLLGLLTLSSGYREKKSNQAIFLPGIITTGVVLLIVGWSSFVGDGMRLLFDDETLVLTLSGLLTGGGLLIGAAMIGKVFTPWTRRELWHQRLMAGVGIVVAFLIFMSTDIQLSLLAVVALIFAAAVIVVGLETRVRLFTWLGVIGGLISTLNLLFSSIDRVTIIILIFILGFGAILLSILVTRRQAYLATTAESSPPWQLGFIDDASANSLGFGTGAAPSFLVVVVRIILFFVFWFLLQFMITSVVGGQSPYSGSEIPVRSEVLPFI